MKRIFVVPAIVGLALLVASQAFAATSYFQGFETDTDDWQNFGGTLTRVTSGTDGITSAAGGYHAVIDGSVFSRYGGYENAFPSGGYEASIDIYLDMSEADGSDKRFDFSSAINQPDGNHRRDFIFNVGTDPLVAGQFAISASNNAPGWPSNPGRSPVAVDETGWYTFKHIFRDNGSGLLEVEMQVLTANGILLGSWVLSDPADVIGSTVGGHRYAWFTSQRFDFDSLAIDNVSLVSFMPPADGDACKKGGWEALTRLDGSAFKNQGDCIQYVNTDR